MMEHKNEFFRLLMISDLLNFYGKFCDIKKQKKALIAEKQSNNDKEIEELNEEIENISKIFKKVSEAKLSYIDNLINSVISIGNPHFMDWENIRYNNRPIVSWDDEHIKLLVNDILTMENAQLVCTTINKGLSKIFKNNDFSEATNVFNGRMLIEKYMRDKYVSMKKHLSTGK